MRPQGAHRGDSCALVRVCGLKQCVPFAGYFGSSHAALFMFTMHMLLAGKVEAGAEAIKRRNDALSVLRTLVPARCGEPSPCAELDRGPDKVRIKGPMNKAKPRAPPPSCVLRVPLRRAIRQAGPRPSRRHAAHAAHAAARSWAIRAAATRVGGRVGGLGASSCTEAQRVRTPQRPGPATATCAVGASGTSSAPLTLQRIVSWYGGLISRGRL